MKKNIEQSESSHPSASELEQMLELARDQVRKGQIIGPFTSVREAQKILRSARKK